jgi:hypothetical protein
MQCYDLFLNVFEKEVCEDSKSQLSRSTSAKRAEHLEHPAYVQIKE